MKKRVQPQETNFIYKNFQQSLAYLPKLKNYFIFSLTLFLLISIFGFLFPYFFEEEIIKLIEELIKQTKGMNFLELSSFILFNNIKSSFFALILGIFLGFIPIGVIVVNAYVLGFISNKTVAIEGPLILWKLLPHGIFEIPAVLLSTALGLYIGSFYFSRKNSLKRIAYLLASMLIFMALQVILFFSIVFFITLINPTLMGNSIDLSNIDAMIDTAINTTSTNPILFLISISLLILSFILGSFILEESDRKELTQKVLNSLKVFFLIIIPLLVIAAIIEGFLIILIG